MKQSIHPDYKKCVVTCACGETFETASLTKELRVEICSNCHPFFTGKQKLIDSGGRVDKFNKRYGKQQRNLEIHNAERRITFCIFLYLITL